MKVDVFSDVSLWQVNALITEAVSYYEMSVNIYQTISCDIPEDSLLQTCHRENLGSHLFVIYILNAKNTPYNRHDLKWISYIFGATKYVTIYIFFCCNVILLLRYQMALVVEPGCFEIVLRQQVSHLLLKCTSFGYGAVLTATCARQALVPLLVVINTILKRFGNGELTLLR
jgi:hypothetical protein